MITVKELTFGYSGKALYKGVNFRISHPEKVGLVGPNGSGKSTLLKLLMGTESQMAGEISVNGSMSYVPQEIKNDPIMEKSDSVRVYVDPKNTYQDFEILKVFFGLELNVSLDTSPKLLSGGQKTKISLARALFEKPSILLLDEPTNFMDTAGKSWVMNFLANYQGTVIVISHDLNLMDSSINKILAINPSTQSIDEYSSNYSGYMKLKEEREERLKREILVKKKHIAQMEEGLKKMARYSSDKGVRRRIQQKKRIEKEKAALPEAPAEIRKIKVSLPPLQKVGEIPIKAIHIRKSYGDQSVLKDISISVKRGERIAFIGPNGAGKSTFIKILMGLLTPDSGEVIKNETLSVGYYSQEFETFDLTQKVIDVFMEITGKNDQFARAFLGRYMLSGDKVFQRIESLSGGEKTRLSIAILTAQSHNLLILDEPTTYLDVLSQRIILEALKEYKGTMIIVSHTPEFLVELEPKRAYLFPDEKEVFWDSDLTSKVSVQ